MAEEPKAGYACFSSQFFQHVVKKITARSQISLYRVGRDNLYTRFFMNFAKYVLIPESVEVEVHTVPHFKAPINASLEL